MMATSLALIAIGLFAAGVVSLVRGRARSRFGSENARRSTVRSSVRVLLSIPGTLLRPAVLLLLGPAARDRVRNRLEAAGRPDDMGLDDYAIAKGTALVLMGAPALICFMSGRWFVGIALVAFGWIIVDLWLSDKERSRREAMTRDLPFFLELLSTATRSGFPIRRALEWTGSVTEGPLGEEIRRVLEEASRGIGLQASLGSLSRRVSSPAIGQLASIARQAHEMGTPTADRLSDLALQLRRSSGRDTRRRAARVGAQINLVMLATIVPATLVLIVGVMLSRTDLVALLRTFSTP